MKSLKFAKPWLFICFSQSENAATIKTLEQQASQSFKLAQEVRERQREIAKLQEQLRGIDYFDIDFLRSPFQTCKLVCVVCSCKGGGGSVISSSLSVASPDLERETIALRTKTKESDEKIRLQLAEIRKLQTELAHSKNVGIFVVFGSGSRAVLNYIILFSDLISMFKNMLAHVKENHNFFKSPIDT